MLDASAGFFWEVSEKLRSRLLDSSVLSRGRVAKLCLYCSGGGSDLFDKMLTISL